MRGGSWKCTDEICRVAIRNGVLQDRGTDDLGFRLAFSVDESNTPTTHNTEPLPLVGTLKVNSSVDDADVYVDSVYVGKVNLVIQNVEVGIHKIVVKKDGFTDFSGKVLVKENLQSDLQAELLRICMPKTISIIIANSSEPMTGAIVSQYRKWEKIRTDLSSIDGTVLNYTITNGDIITVSYVGYKSKEIHIKDVNAIDGTLRVQMTKGNNKKKETLVIGE